MLGELKADAEFARLAAALADAPACRALLPREDARAPGPAPLTFSMLPERELVRLAAMLRAPELSAAAAASRFLKAKLATLAPQVDRARALQRLGRLGVSPRARAAAASAASADADKWAKGAAFRFRFAGDHDDVAWRETIAALNAYARARALRPALSGMKPRPPPGAPSLFLPRSARARAQVLPRAHAQHPRLPRGRALLRQRRGRAARGRRQPRVLRAHAVPVLVLNSWGRRG